MNFWKKNWAQKKTDSELTITNQSDFDHHAEREKKTLHYQITASIFMKKHCV